MIKKKRYEESVGAVISYPASSKSSSLLISESKIPTTRKFLILRSLRGDWNFVKGHKENIQELENIRYHVFVTLVGSKHRLQESKGYQEFITAGRPRLNK